MEGKKTLIVGVDPGTTLGYAVVDLEGNLVEVNSSKGLTMSDLIKHITLLGRVAVVGTDKKNIPFFVQKFANNLGAKIMHPEEDMLIKTKKQLTKNYPVNDLHQMDALSSALFAFKSLRQLLRKIEVFAEHNNKEKLKEDIAYLVITKGISIRNAAELFEPKEENVIVRKVVEERKLTEKDFIRLYNKLKTFERDNFLLKQQNERLVNDLNKTKKYEKPAKAFIDKKTKELLKFKENKINFFYRGIKQKEEKINDLNNEINILLNFLSDLKNNYLLKKLENLGYNEYVEKKKILNIDEGDILLVNNPNVVSEKTINELKNRIVITIHKMEISKKVREALPFVFIDSKKLKIRENKFFGIVDKKELEREKNITNVLNKIVEDYRREKTIVYYNQ